MNNNLNAYNRITFSCIITDLTAIPCNAICKPKSACIDPKFPTVEGLCDHFTLHKKIISGSVYELYPKIKNKKSWSINIIGKKKILH